MRKTPALYAKSSHPFWDDAHISRSMLQAHLSPDTDGASRTHAFILKSADWITAYANAGAGKTLLDLGCGPGLYAQALADRGFCVTGLDFSKRSIEYAMAQARARGTDIAYRYQDYRTLTDADAFDAVILVYCDFGVLAPQDRRTLLRKIRKALKRGGVLLLDGWNAPHLDTFRETKTLRYEERGFWSAAPCVLIARSRYYRETRNTLEQYLVVTERDCRCYNIWNAIFSRETLTKELSDAGFSEPDFFDDIAGAPFTGHSETICIAARKTE